MSSVTAAETTTPTFVANLVAIGTRAMTLQARKLDQLPLKQNLLENVERVYASKIKWCNFIVEHMKDEHKVVREKIVKAKQAVDASNESFVKTVKPELPASQFYALFLQELKLFTSKCCLLHNVVRFGYIECIENDLQLMVRALLLCRESMSSKNQLVEKFNLTTVVIARIAETCSSVAAQKTTTEQTANVLNGHFDNLNDLNELLADHINEYLAANYDMEQEPNNKVVQTIRELELIVDETRAILTEERAFIRRNDNYADFNNHLNSNEVHKEIQAEVHKGEIEHIRERGAVKRLEKLEAQTGQKPPEALQKLAEESDTLGVTIQNIYYAIKDSDAMDLREAVAQAPAAIEKIAQEAKRVITQEAAKQEALTKQAKEVFAAQQTELDHLSSEVKNMAKGTVQPEAVRKGIDNVVAHTIRVLDTDGTSMLGLGDATRTNHLKSQLKRTSVGAVFDSSKTSPSSTIKATADSEQQQLDKAVNTMKADISKYTSSLDQDAANNQRMLESLDKDISAQVEQVSSLLINAANAVMSEGLDESKKQGLLEAVETVENFAELSNAILPAIEIEPSQEPPPPSDLDLEMKLKFDDSPPPIHSMKLLSVNDSPNLGIGSLPPSPMSSPAPVRSAGNFEREKVEVVIIAPPETPRVERKKEVRNDKPVGVVRRAIRNIETLLEELERAAQPDGLLKVLHRRHKDDDEEGQLRSNSDGSIQPKKSSSVGDLLAATGGLHGEETNKSMTIRPDGMSTDWINWRRQNLKLGSDNIWNEQGMLLFGKEDGKVIIKAGTLNQIMLHLTSPLDNAADALAGSDFYRTFMMTLQTFIEPEIFVQKMIERYNVPAAPPNVPEEDYAHDVKNPVQMRVCNLLKKWIIARYDQDLAHKPRLIEDLDQFIETVGKDSEYLSTNLRQCFSLYLSGERFLYHKNLAQGGSLNVPKSGPDASIFHPYSHFDPKEIAEQLTLIDAENFRAIRLYELAGQAWSKKDAPVKCPNLMRMINHTNHLSTWVAASIVQEPKLRRRKKIMSNMIQLLQYLRTLNNFHAVMGVLAGLSMAAVSRLKYTIHELPSRVRKMQEDIELEMSSLGSFRIYRENVKKAVPPVIPFMGVMLSDLTFVEDGNPNMTEAGLINWIKRSLLYNVLSQFTEYQRTCYFTMPEKRFKDALLSSIEKSQTSPTQLYNGSLLIEPRDGEQPPQTMGFSAWSILQRRFAGFNK